jgi:hypothetical protein
VGNAIVTTATRPRYLSLAEVSRLTGRHPELLRQWCAAGRLPCERIGGSWAILEEHLALVQAQPARGRRRGRLEPVADKRSVVAAAFPDGQRGRLVHQELTRRFGLHGDDVALAPLALDGIEFVLIAGRFPSERVGEVTELIRGLGGRIVADIDRPWTLPAIATATDGTRSTSRRTR